MSRSCHFLSHTYNHLSLPVNFVPVIKPKITKELTSPLILKVNPLDESDTFTLDTSQEKNEREKEDFFEKKSKTVVY